MRVYEVAKEINVPVKDVLTMLSENGITDKGQMSSVTDEEYALLNEKFAEVIKKAEEEKARLEAEKKLVLKKKKQNWQKEKLLPKQRSR